MADMADRLKERISYLGLLQKEVAARAGIKKRALDMYIGSQKSMPPADIAVKLAAALGVTVEYLVTGAAETRARRPAEPEIPAGVSADVWALIRKIEALDERARAFLYKTVNFFTNQLQTADFLPG